MGEIWWTFLILIVASFYSTSDSQDYCPVYNLEENFDSILIYDDLECESIGIPWEQRSYQEIALEPPDSRSAHFMTPSQTDSCGRTANTFNLTDGGILEANCYIEVPSPADVANLFILVIDMQNRQVIYDDYVNSGFHSNGWHLVRIDIDQDIESVYVVFMGTVPESSRLLIDYFRYVESEDLLDICSVYPDISSSEETDTGETDTDETDTGETDTGETDTGETDTGETDTGETDTGETDTGETDTREVDSGETDTGETDTDETDTGETDTGETDTGETDTGETDTSEVDSGETDTGETDTDETDTGETDTGEIDTGETDTGETDTGETDTGETDTGETDTGETDTGETDTGEIDTGEADTGEADTGEADTGETDTGETDTVETETGETDTGETDTGETNTGETDTGETDTSETDTGETDTSETDTGETDTSETDTGETDTSETDTGETDTEEADTGEIDTGETDSGGTDSGETDSNEDPVILPIGNRSFWNALTITSTVVISMLAITALSVTCYVLGHRKARQNNLLPQLYIEDVEPSKTIRVPRVRSGPANAFYNHDDPNFYA